MGRAVLQIDASTAGIAAAFGSIRTMAQDTERAVRASMGGLFAGIPAASRRTTQGVYRDAAEMTRGVERESSRALAAFIRNEETKRRVAALTAAGRERAERQATEFAASEARKRGLSAEQEARVRTSAMERITRSVEREERQQTATMQREAKKRERLGRDVAFGVRRGLNVGGDAAMNVARTAHSQIQDARRQRAEETHTLNAAFYQAGVGGSEAAGYRRQLEAALTTGGLRGMSMGTIADAIQQAQTQSSVLSGRSAGERAENFQQQIRLAEFARNTYQDPAEVLRVGGVLRKQGVTGSAQMDLLRSLTGIGQAGSVELSDVVSTGLQPIMQSVGIAQARLGRNATAAQRARATSEAVTESMAAIEVGAGGGLSVRHGLSAYAGLQRLMQSESTAEKAHTALRARGFTEAQITPLVRQERDARSGRMVRRFTGSDALASVSLMSEMFGGNTTEMINALQGGGRAHMVLPSNVRTFISGLESQTQGVSVRERVNRMRAEGARFGEADVNRGRDMIEAEERTALQSAEETRVAALTMDTAATRFSNAVDNFAKANPIGSAAAQSIGGLASGALGGLAINRAGVALGGSAIAARVAAAGGVIPALAAVKASALGSMGALAGSVGAASTATIGAVGAGSALVGGGVGTLLNRAIYSDRTRSTSDGRTTATSSGQAAYTNVFSSDFWRGFSTSVAQAVRDGMASAPVTATVSPVDATHAAANAAPRR